MSMGEAVKTGARFKSQKTVFVVGGAVIFVLAVAASFFFWQYTEMTSDPAVMSQERTKKLTASVGQLYNLPDEEPTVAEISDVDKLKGQDFFKGAENGDTLFIFQNEKLALLYRESANKLINVGPITVSAEDDQQNLQQKDE